MEPEKLYGRDQALRLVREFLIRDERNGALHSRQYPVIVFTGPRGIGKTALLNELGEPDRQLDQRIPYAYVDCEHFRGGTRELLWLLAFELNRRCYRYGRLAFPRLITGQIAIAAKLAGNPDDRAKVQQALEERQQTGPLLDKTFSDVAGSVLDALPEPHGLPPYAASVIKDLASTYGPALLRDALGRSRRGRAVLLGKGQDWYSHQDRSRHHDSIDVLVDLSRRAAAKDARSRRQAEELLWTAFLADLTESFRHSRWAIDRTLNCVILLDNADTPIGRAFLDQLVTARQRRSDGKHADPDPATVVATSRGALTERLRSRGVQVTALTDAGYSDYRVRAAAGTKDSTWWYPVVLPDLGRQDLGDWIKDWTRELKFPEETRDADTTMVYGFTRGHPGAAQGILDSLRPYRASAGNPARPADQKSRKDRTGGRGLRDELPDILDSPAPGDVTGESHDKPSSVAASLLDRLTESISPAAVEDLVTCSAARYKEAALRMAVDSGLLEQRDGDSTAIFTPEFWLQAAAPPGARMYAADAVPLTRDAGARATLHPVLRRLLLRRLAERDPDSQASWQRVHEWLRACSLDVGDEPGELYHALALGEVEYVARALARSLKTAPGIEWLTLLDSVTAAPNQLDPRQPPRDQVPAMTRWADEGDQPLASLGRLIVASWICADPLRAVSRLDLRRKWMAPALERIAPYSEHGHGTLADEASRYREDGDDDD